MPKMDAEREATLSGLEAKGVVIPLWDGVVISREADIAPGAVILAGTVISGHSSVGAGSVIGPNSFVSNSVVGRDCAVKACWINDSELEDNVEIGPFCNVRPGSLIKRGVHIGDFVEVKNSTVGSGTKIAHLTYVGDTDCGERVNFGCGVVTVNYDGRAKHRTTIGDDVFIGCNTNLMAPVKVGDGAYVAAATNVTEDVPADALAIGRARQQIKEGRAAGYKKKK